MPILLGLVCPPPLFSFGSRQYNRADVAQCLRERAVPLAHC